MEVSSHMNKRVKYFIVQSLSFSRIAFAVAIVVSFLADEYTLATTLAVIGFLTDYFDGRLARKWGVVSKFGATIDPLTDKILCLAIISALAVTIHPLYWVIFGLFAVYDTITTSIRLCYPSLTMPASPLAKLKTSTQMVALLILMASMILSDRGLRDEVIAIGSALLVFAAFLTFFALGRYIRALSQHLSK